jgi:2-polyprenyl-3-methyl-5-hydroxy-6-metoxy-1,4-benzoquinol methylase
MNRKLIKNKYGYFEIARKPSEKELSEYYTRKYYQTDKGSYSKSYSEDESEYKLNKIDEKYFVIKHILKNKKLSTLIDIGCGEGWTLSCFQKKHVSATGLDYSNFGCKHHNPHCLKNLIAGDIYTSIDKLIKNKKTYDIILLDNVLEHVTNPLSLLKNCRKLAKAGSILIVEVPNDFSALQTYLLKHKYINKEFWVAYPDHLSYFNKDGLVALASAAGWKSRFVMSDNPIDFNLLNKNANYVNNKSKGPSCHKARITLDNFMHGISVEKTVDYFHSLAELGLGRQIVAFFTLN